jgi:hypothetical protein
MPFTPPSLLARNRSLGIHFRVMIKFRICHMQRAVRRYYCEQNSVSKAGFAVNDKAWNNRGSHVTVLLCWFSSKVRIIFATIPLLMALFVTGLRELHGLRRVGCCEQGSMGAVGGRRITTSEVKFLDRGKTTYSAGIFQVCLR